MTRGAAIVFAAAAAVLFATAANAEWVTTITTNRWEYDGVEYLESASDAFINTHSLLQEGSVAFKFLLLSNTQSYPKFFGGVNVDNNASRRLLFCMNGSVSKKRLDCGSLGYVSYSTDLIEQDKIAYSISGDVGLSYICIFNSSYSNGSYGSGGNSRCHYFRLWDDADDEVFHLVPVVHNGEGKMLDLVHNTLYANAGTGAFSYGAVTGTVTYTSITTNRVYRANPPVRAADAASPWNAPDRTRLGGDDRTLRPSAIIKE